MPDDATDLYVLPRDQFTAARNELAKKLREEGETDEAGRVARLQKPSVAAWALNRLARNRPDEIDKLIATHSQVREATSSGALREASQARNDQVARLTDLAIEELESDGRTGSAQSRDRIFRTLLAVSSNPESEAELRAGCLAHEVEPSGEGWGNFALPSPAPADPNAEARRAAEQARVRAEQLETEAEKAERQVETAKEALTVARRRAKEARAAADRAAEEAQAAERSATS